jgi:putative transposase
MVNMANKFRLLIAKVHERLDQCGYEHHADVVGAINILERGLRLSARGEEGAGLARKRKTQPASKKQEPAEETHAIAA